MFGSVVLDVALALALAFLLLSVLCSSMREGIEAWFNSRAVHLHRAIVELLNNEKSDLAKELYKHPQVGSLFQGKYEEQVVKDRPKGKWRPTWWLQWLWSKVRDKPRESGSLTGWAKRYTTLPAYIPSRNFALALVDIAVRGNADQVDAAASTAPLTVQSIRDGAARLSKPFVGRAILNAFDGTNATLESGMENLEQWYNAAMERATGWYKKETQRVLFLLGLTVAFLGNVDAVRIARELYSDKPKREAIVQQATRVAGDTTVLRANAEETRKALDALVLPIGWTTAESGLVPWSVRFWERIAGWFVTALAVSFGAPFWFDLLSRFVQLRAATKPKEKEDEESKVTVKSKTTQPGGAAATVSLGPSVVAGGVAGAPAAAVGNGAFVPHKWASAGDNDEGVV